MSYVVRCLRDSVSTGSKRMRAEGRSFFDTNILIYAFAEGDPRAPIAESLLARGGVVGVQNLNEFASVAVRTLKMPWPEVLEALTVIRTLCPVCAPLTVETHDLALTIHERCQYHVYDSLVVAAALRSSSGTLYSEDMRDGDVIEGLTIRNPFPKLKHS